MLEDDVKIVEPLKIIQKKKRKKYIKYNYEFLASFCDENGIKLRHDYSNAHITCETKIKAICIRCDEDMIEKDFRTLVRNQNFGCIDCSKIIANERYIQTNLENFGCEYPINNIEIKEKIKNTMLERYGVEYSGQDPNALEKMQSTNLLKYGVKHVSQNETVKEKNTNLNRYGNEILMNNKEIKEKYKETNLVRHGYDNPFSNSKTHEKSKATNMVRYGSEYSASNENVKEKVKNTSIELYGFPCVFQNESVKEKSKATMVERHGFEHASQNAIIAEKILKNSFKSKEYIFPSGRIDMIQGYEHFALNFLLNVEKINEDDIITSCTQVPEIWWTDNTGKNHRYYIDIFIISQNKGIEVKSQWTFNKETDKVLVKRDAFILSGYECDIWIFDDKGNRTIYDINTILTI